MAETGENGNIISLEYKSRSGAIYIPSSIILFSSEIESIKRLKNPKAKVSCHYVISRKGQVTQMVKDKFIAWHAGKSRWGNDKNLNLKSIGIELVNKGDEKFPFLQIKSLCILIKYLKNKHKIQKKHVLGHSHIAPGRKIDPGVHFPWKKLSNQKLSNNH